MSSTPRLAVAFATYLPRLQLRRLLSGAGLPPWCEQRPAAVLFVDVSGFTALTEQLSRRGAAGAEALSEIINAYFGRISEIAAGSGGDLLSFAGDAALLLWPAESPGRLAEATCLAAQTALAMQTELAAGRTDPGALELRASIGAGTVTLMGLGDHDLRAELLVSGDPLAQVAAVDRQGAAGAVTLSPSAWDLVRDRCLGLVVEGGTRLTSVLHPVEAPPQAPTMLPPELLPLLRRQVATIIADRLEAGQENWLGEFRNVSVAFINLRGVDAADPDALPRLHAAVSGAQHIVARLEGTVYQFLTDDKGTTLIVAFGLPPRSHEDDPGRAVRAALALRDQFATRGIETDTGVATGLSFCGVYGSSHRRQYTIAGPAVNLAARLMQAGNGIRCDLTTMERARHAPDLAFEPLPPIRVKGKPEPVTSYQPREVTAPATPRTSIPAGGVVGRDAERAALDQALDRLQAAQGGVVLIEGEPGIGKSRLVEYLRERAGARAIPVVVGACGEVEKATPYYAWRSVFRALVHDGRLAPEPGIPALLRLLAEDPGLGPSAPLLAAVLPIDLPDNQLTGFLTEEARAQQTRALLVALLGRAAAGAPLAIVLEDAQWLDSSSWSLAGAVAQELPGVLLLLSLRPPDPEPPGYRLLAGWQGTRRLALSELPAADTRALLCQRLGVRSLPEPVALLIESKAGGNPFYSEELAFALRDFGLLTVREGRCEIAGGEIPLAHAFERELAQRGIPVTLQGIVFSRIDRLSAEEQLVLKVASVLGRRFRLSALAAVFPVAGGRDDLLLRLRQLERLDLTCAEGTDPEPAFRFRHVITQEAAYNSLLFAQRRGLHRAAAEWHETEDPAERASLYPTLAHHWGRAGDAPRAAHYLGSAGAEALRGYANEEAVGFFRQALELDATGDGSAPVCSVVERARWELQLGKAYVNWSRYPEGEGHLVRGLALHGERVPRHPVAVAGSVIGQMFRQTVHRFWPRRYVGRRAGERERLLEDARAYEGLVETYFLQNSTLPCLRSAMRSLNLAELAGPSAELARGYASVGAIVGFIPAHGMAEAYGRRALATARQAGDGSAIGWVSMAIGVYKIGVGAWDEALALLGETRTLAERMGDRRRWDDALQNLAAVWYLRGEVDRSLALAGELYASAARRSDLRGQAVALRRRIFCLQFLGRAEEIPEALEELSSLQWGIGDVYRELPVLTLRALAAFRAGDLTAAAHSTRLAGAVAARSSPTFHDILLEYAALAELTLGIRRASPGPGDAAEFRGESRRALKRLAGYARVFPIGRPFLWLWRGAAARLDRQPARAIAAWTRSVAYATELDMPHAEGLARAELAEHLPATDPQRQVHFREAGRLFERLSAAPDRQRLTEKRPCSTAAPTSS